MNDLDKKLNKLSQEIGTKLGDVAKLARNITSKDYVNSKNGLVTNGSGLLADNTNFSKYIFEPTQLQVGKGSFKVNTNNADCSLDEPIAIDLSSNYEFSFYAKQDYGTSNRFYAYVACLDMDGEPIYPYNLAKNQGSYYVIDNEITKDTTSIKFIESHRTSFFNEYWNPNKSSAVPLYINDAAYTSKSGFHFPLGTYSRNTLNTPSSHASLTYNLSTGILSGLNFKNLGNKVIAKGNAVSFAQPSGTYIYPIPAATDGILSNQWQEFRGIVDGSKLRPFTSLIKLGFLCNRGGTGDSAQLFNSIYFNRLQTNVTAVPVFMQTNIASRSGNRIRLPLINIPGKIETSAAQTDFLIKDEVTILIHNPNNLGVAGITGQSLCDIVAGDTGNLAPGQVRLVTLRPSSRGSNGFFYLQTSTLSSGILNISILT